MMFARFPGAATYTIWGDVMLARANRPLKAGEEAWHQRHTMWHRLGTDWAQTGHKI